MFILNGGECKRARALGRMAKDRREEFSGTAHFRLERVRWIHNNKSRTRKTPRLGVVVTPEVNIEANGRRDSFRAQLAAESLGGR
jgi:hypothetical protein